MQNRNFIGIGEKVFDILVTQRKPEIKPDGLLDYGARETVDANDGSFSEVVSGPERDAQRL